MTPEKLIEYQIFNFLKIHRVFCWKNESTGVFDPKKKVFRTNKNPHKIKGVSDILGVFEGKPLAIEVKSYSGTVRKEQKEFIKRINEEGGIAFVARSIEDVAEKLGLRL